MTVKHRVRWLPRLVVAMLVAAGVNLAMARPAVAVDVPVVTITGSAGCTAFYGDTSVTWNVVQTPHPDGYTYGGTVTFEVSPATAYYPNSYSIAAPIQVRQTIPHGTGATTARLTVVIDFAINGGHEVVTRTSSISLPFCAKSVRASVSFAMKCDRSVDVTINYPATAEASTTAAIVGTSLSGARWESGPITLRAGGEVRTLLVPSPYTTDIVVTQKDAAATTENGVIGRSGSLAQPTACAGWPTGGAPILPPPAGGSGGGGTSGGAPAGGGSDPGAALPSGPELPEPTATASGASSAARTGPATGPRLAEPAAPDRLGFPVTAAVGGLLVGFGTMVVVGGVVAAFLFVRQRRRPSSPSNQ